LPGKIVVFEGPEGSGKSTQAKKALNYLRKKGKKAVLLREPGGTRISEKIRSIILDPKHREMSPETELLLYEAARAQVCREKIIPFLKKGYTVILDRFFTATNVYQGRARGLSLKMIKILNDYAVGSIKTGLVIIYDVSLKEAAKRMGARKKDRMENEKAAFHLKVRKGYLAEARKEKNAAVITTDGKTSAEVFKETIALLNKKRAV